MDERKRKLKNLEQEEQVCCVIIALCFIYSIDILFVTIVNIYVFIFQLIATTKLTVGILGHVIAALC